MKHLVKKIFASVLATGLVFVTAACGGGSSNETTSPGSSGGDLPKLHVGSTIVPHAEILAQVKPLLAEKGYDLVIHEFTDYVTPNNALVSKDLDANYFQHQPFLDNFNKENNQDLVGLVKVHFEPLSVYKANLDSIDALVEGSKIGVPNDTTNEARALQLLEAQGLIKLKEGVGLEATPNDIIENELNLEIVELGAENITNLLKSLDLAVINGNYALTAGLGADDILASEATDSDAAETFGNVIAVRSGDEDRADIKAFIDIITGETISKWITEEYQGSVVPLN